MTSGYFELAVVLGAAFISVEAFFPSLIHGMHFSTYTHTDITRIGVFRAVNSLLVKKKLTKSSYNPVGDFFGTDKENKMKFYSIVDNIVAATNNIQSAKVRQAKYSVNGEQIQEGHNLVCQLRTEIKSLDEDTLTDETMGLIREKIGHAFFVIQSFYSNTNWVDMNGATVYEDFGVCGKKLIPIASQGQDTCRDCSILVGGCEDTLLVQKLLTSGYRSGQDISKPLKLSSIRITTGKCSHGGRNDLSRNTPAKGGINKETLDTDYSPIANLHKDAAKAAIAATEYFLIGQDSRVVGEDGGLDFVQIFRINRRLPTSLTFVLDVTGSMSDEILEVKEACINYVTGVAGTNNEPSKYVLTTFSDPEYLTTQYETTVATEMIEQLNNLTANGGGDCAEYAMDGLLKGIELATANSTVYLFTDAPAKDCANAATVINRAAAKSIKLRLFVMLTCGQDFCTSGRKKRDDSEQYRSLHVKDDRYNDMFEWDESGKWEDEAKRQKRSASLYEQIALSTGGTLHRTEVSTVLDELIKSDQPSSQVLVQMVDIPVTGNTPFEISVDSDIKLLKIEIKGSTADNQASLKNPLGVEEHTLHYFSNGKIIITVVNPGSGVWTLVKNGAYNWNVRITAEASMDISYRLLESNSEGYAYQIQGNPIAGQNYTLEVSVWNVIQNATDYVIVVMAKNGEEIVSSPGSCIDSVVCKVCLITFTVPTEKAYIQLQGRDENGAVFSRTSDSPILPVRVKLTLGVIVSSLYVEMPQKLTYTLTNAGSGNETFTVNYVDSYSGSATDRHYLMLGESVGGSFEITGTSNGDVVKYTISVTTEDDSVPLQSLSNTIIFTSKQHPVCKVIDITGNCSSSVGQCIKTTWSTTSQISYSGVSLQNVYLSNVDSSVTLDYDNNTGSPVKVTVSGTCCTTSVYINVIDDESYSDRCHLKLGDVNQIIIEVPDAPHNTGTQEQKKYTTILIMILCGSAFGLIFVLWTTFIVMWKCSVPSDTKRKDLQDKKYLTYSVKEDRRNRKTSFPEDRRFTKPCNPPTICQPFYQNRGWNIDPHKPKNKKPRYPPTMYQPFYQNLGSNIDPENARYIKPRNLPTMYRPYYENWGSNVEPEDERYSLPYDTSSPSCSSNGQYTVYFGNLGLKSPVQDPPVDYLLY